MTGEVAAATGAAKAGWFAFGWFKKMSEAAEKVAALEARVTSLEQLLAKDRDPRQFCPSCGDGRLTIHSSYSPADLRANEDLGDARHQSTCGSCETWWVLDANMKPLYRY